MTEVTAPQQESLDNFTVQRDSLQKEVAGLLLVRDQLTKTNTELSTANSAIVEELVANQLRMKDEIGADDLELERVRIDVTKEENNLKFILQRKSEITDDMVVLTSLVNGVNDLIAEAKTGTDGVLANLTDVTLAVNDNLAVIKNSTTDVTNASREALQLITNLKNYTVAEETAMADKKAKLDARELQLNDRETAINNTYSSLLQEMEVKAINLSDLKPA